MPAAARAAGGEGGGPHGGGVGEGRRWTPVAALAAAPPRRRRMRRRGGGGGPARELVELLGEVHRRARRRAALRLVGDLRVVTAGLPAVVGLAASHLLPSPREAVMVTTRTVEVSDQVCIILRRVGENLRQRPAVCRNGAGIDNVEPVGVVRPGVCVHLPL